MQGSPEVKLKTSACKRKLVPKKNIGELSKAIKEVQNLTTPSEINNSYSHSSNTIYESATASAKGKLTKRFSKKKF